MILSGCRPYSTVLHWEALSCGRNTSCGWSTEEERSKNTPLKRRNRRNIRFRLFVWILLLIKPRMERITAVGYKHGARNLPTKPAFKISSSRYASSWRLVTMKTLLAWCATGFIYLKWLFLLIQVPEKQRTKL